MRLGVNAQFALAGLVFAALLYGVVDGRLEVLVEVLEHGVPVFLSLCDGVELLLHVGGEVVVHDVREVLHEEVVYDGADVCREQLSLLATRHLGLRLCRHLVSGEGIDGVRPFFTLLVALDDVFALLYGGYCRGVR